MDKQKQQEAYKNYVKQKTPVHNLPLNMLKAFITGGIICTIGQGILNYCRHLGIEKDISAGWTSMILILLSVLLTGFNIYPQIAKWGGAGALVPITSDYRICKLRGGTGNRISERRTGHGNRLQDIYHSRSGDIIWNLFKLGTWSGVLDIEDFESDVKNFLDSGQQISKRSR